MREEGVEYSSVEVQSLAMTYSFWPMGKRSVPA